MTRKPALLAVLATLLAFICMGVSPLRAFAEGTQTLGPPGIPIASGTGLAAAGTGMVAQPAAIEVEVPPGAAVKQVLLYWSGYSISPNPGDPTIRVNATDVTGTLIGGPMSNQPGTHNEFAYRADITSLDLVGPGSTTLPVEGLDFVGGITNGAGRVGDL